jgi:hypothetical protein
LVVLTFDVSLNKSKKNIIHTFFRDMIGDMGFSGGFETMAAADDVDGWMEMVCP